jgi:hypothetical protein
MACPIFSVSNNAEYNRAGTAMTLACRPFLIFCAKVIMHKLTLYKHGEKQFSLLAFRKNIHDIEGKWYRMNPLFC